MIKLADKKISYWFKHDKGLYIGLWTIFAVGVGDFLNDLIGGITHIDSFILTMVIGVMSIILVWYVVALMFEKKQGSKR